MSLKTPLRIRQLRRARRRKAINQNNLPSQPAQARTSKADFLEALKGTGGIKSDIARNLDCNLQTVINLLRRPDWQDIKEEYDAEVEKGVDQAESAIMYAIKQRLDIGNATLNARWLLSRRRKEIYGDEKPIQQGDVNVNVNNSINTVNVDVDALKLPVEIKRQLLAAIDAKAEQDKQKMIDVPARSVDNE